MVPVAKDNLQSSPIYRTYSAGAQDLTNQGPNAGSSKGQMCRAIFYKGAMTVTDHAGTSVVLIPTSDYTLYPIQVATVSSSANDYQVLW